MLWTAQDSENEAYIKNERPSGVRVYSNSGEQIFALDGLPVFTLSGFDSLWIKQVSPTQSWE